MQIESKRSDGKNIKVIIKEKQGELTNIKVTFFYEYKQLNDFYNARGEKVGQGYLTKVDSQIGDFVKE